MTQVGLCKCFRLSVSFIESLMRCIIVVTHLNGILRGDAGSLGEHAIYIVGVMHRSGLANRY